MFLHDIAHRFRSHLFEKLLVDNGVIGLLSVDHDDVHTGNSDGSGVVQGVIHKLLLNRDLKLPLLLLELDDDVLHVLLDLILFLQLKPGAGVESEFWVVLVLLLAD